MTMLENTISMIKVMPEADLAEIQNGEYPEAGDFIAEVRKEYGI